MGTHITFVLKAQRQGNKQPLILILNINNLILLIIILINSYECVKTCFYNSDHLRKKRNVRPDGERQQPPPEPLHRIHMV